MVEAKEAKVDGRKGDPKIKDTPRPPKPQADGKRGTGGKTTQPK